MLLALAGFSAVLFLSSPNAFAACNARDHTQYAVGLDQTDDNDPLVPENRMYSLCADGDQRHEDVTYEIKITPRVDGDGIPLTVTAKIDGEGTTADVKFSDGTTEKMGLEDGDTVTLETQDIPEGTHGTWKLRIDARIDADNVLEGTDDPDCHASVNEYVIRPNVLTVECGRNPDNNKTDNTLSDGTPENNTLYLCQDPTTPGGVATAKTDLTWFPSELNLHLGHWKIVDKASGELASNWKPDPPEGQFSSEGKVVAVWTDPGGEPNREFTLRAGFDCNKNDELEDGESRRMLHITVTKVKAALTVKDDGSATSDANPGPNSRGVLGLFNARVGPNIDWRQYCEDTANGSIVSGPADYTGTHLLAVGSTLLKEMYAHITDRGGLADAVIEDTENWRFWQEMKGRSTYNGTTAPPYGRDYPDWTPDPGGIAHASAIAEFDLANDYLYMGDTPGLVRMNPTMGNDGDVYEKNRDYRTWIEFKCPSSGNWIRVSPVVQHGVTVRLKKVAGAWIIENQAAPK